MIIGIDASRAFSGSRTGTEEYSYQVIRHLRDFIPSDWRVVLYLRNRCCVDFPLPPNWTTRVIKMSVLWTQVGLSWEMLFHAPDILFVPAHAVPLIHPENTIVTIHGLEYERCPGSYRLRERFILRLLTRLSCHFARRIITVSESTRDDLVRFYGVPEGRIRVIHEGGPESDAKKGGSEDVLPFGVRKPFFLFVGRMEKRKNVERIIKAFDLFRKAIGLDYQLILAGSPGYGYSRILRVKRAARFGKDIILMGRVSEEQKKALLAQAEIFLFPSLCEGFGLPILEAQNAGVPVITSDISSMPEVAGKWALCINPHSCKDISNAMMKVVADTVIKSTMIADGFANARRFSWNKCAEELIDIFKKIKTIDKK